MQETFFQALRDYRARWHTEWPHLSGTVDRFQTLAGSWPRCLERSAMPGHLTASAWVCDPSGEYVLLTHHRKLDRWVQLGGHADGDEDLLSVARKEAEEEAGAVDLRQEGAGTRREEQWSIFDLDIHPIPPYNGVPAHLHFDVRFAFTAPDRARPLVSHESYDVQWVPIHRLDTYTREPSMHRMAAKWRAYVR